MAYCTDDHSKSYDSIRCHYCRHMKLTFKPGSKRHCRASSVSTAICYREIQDPLVLSHRDAKGLNGICIYYERGRKKIENWAARKL